MSDKISRIVLFDGVCHLCNNTVNFIIKHDPCHKIKFATMQSSYGQNFLKQNNLPTETFDSFIYIENTKVFTKSTAYILVMQNLVPPWSWLQYIKIIPRFIRDKVYDFIARNRYRWFGKKAQCILPSEDVKNRFLD